MRISFYYFWLERWRLLVMSLKRRRCLVVSGVGVLERCFGREMLMFIFGVVIIL